MQPKARMTFRFDPPPKPQQDKLPAAPLKKAEEKQNEPAPDVLKPDRSGGGPLQDDPYTLEELIRGYEPQAAFSPYSVHEDHVSTTGASGVSGASRATGATPFGDQEDHTYLVSNKNADGDASPELYGWTLQDSSRGWKVQRQSRGGGPSWWRALATVAGAIATGALFGYLALTLFTGEPLFPAGSESGQAALPQPSVQVQPSDRVPLEAAGAIDSPASAAAKQTLPGETYYFLQYGVFQSDEGLKTALADLKNRGLPASADHSDVYRAYAGAAPSKEEAVLLAGQMPNVEVFIKPVAIGPVQAAMPEEFGAFVVSSHELAKQLLRISTLALQDDLPQPIEEAELAALQENHRLWLQTVPAAQGLTGSLQEAGAAMVQAMNEAVAHVEDYNRKNSRYHLWGIQTNMMDLILADQQWRAGLAEAQ